MKLAFLCSEYPAISHTFVMREIEACAGSARDDTFSIRATPPERLLSERDRGAAATTVAILPPRPGRLLAAHLRIALRSPATYARTLRHCAGPRPAGPARPALAGLLLRRGGGARGRVPAPRHPPRPRPPRQRRRRRRRCSRPTSAPRWSPTRPGHVELHHARPDRVRRPAPLPPRREAGERQLRRLHQRLRPQPADGARATGGLGAAAGRPLGMPVDRFTRARRARRRPARPAILYIGRLVPEKGQERAARGGRRRSPATAATSASPSPAKAPLRPASGATGRAARHRRPGRVPRRRWPGPAARALRSATIFCLPSFAEGVPVVLMEAMAMDVPVISTRIAGIPELIEDGVGGLLVAPGRADRLADGARVAADAIPRCAANLGSRARSQGLGASSTAEASAAPALRAVLRAAAGPAPASAWATVVAKAGA